MNGLRGFGLTGLVLASAVLCEAGAEPADEMIGAEAAIRQWQEKPSEPDAAEQAPAADPLRDDLEAFASAWPAMSASDAAAGWLTLYDRWALAQNQGGGYGDFGGYGGYNDFEAEPLELADVVRAIPGPDVWPTLMQQVEARSVDKNKTEERALRMLTFYLGGDQAAFESEAEAAVTFAEKLDAYYGRNLLEAIAPLTDVQGDGDSLEALREMIQRAQTNPDSIYEFEVPDLVTLYGEEEARALLASIVVLPIDSIEINVGDATRALATRVALEQIDELEVPQWGLVASVDADSVALFEALEKKFVKEAAPPPDESEDGLLDKLKRVSGLSRSSYGYDDFGYGYGGNSWRQAKARVIYLLGLVVLDRIDDATAVVEAHYTSAEQEVDLPWGLMETLQASGVVRPLFDFSERMVSAGHGEAFWSIYIQLGAQLEESDRVLERVEAAMEGVEGEARASLLQHLVSARLAADNVESGVEALREMIVLQLEFGDERGTAAMTGYARLAQIGHLMDNDAWLNEGLEKTIAALDQPAHSNGYDRWGRRSARSAVMRVLMDSGRVVEAERLLVDAAGRAVRKYEREARSSGQGNFGEITQAMVDLTVFYGETERWDDVLTLVEDSPYWGAADLKTIYREDSAVGKRPLAVYVARALQARGQSGVALTIVNAMLDDAPGEDALYPLLIELDPKGASARLDALFARDQFEERPLIWKASLQFEAGEIDAADATIRQAISVDPSDGEQGPGDRMRAYAVFAKILRAQGDADTAEVMEGAVRAIRMSEEADEFDRAGLLSRAVAMYKDALTHFADAYCIQSRLAIQLANLGRYDEAAAHYERAYELMPDSFGRVESHCFGCEGAFTGERAQTIAERVFDRLVMANPFKPQVHYLRGYLNAAQGLDQAALENYREAVRLDPDYLNAWAKIQRLSRRMQVDRDQQDQTALAIFRLDPLGRHTSAALNGVGDLGAAWRVVEVAQPLRVQPPESLLALPASATWIEERLDPDEMRYMKRHDRRDELPTPGGFLAEHAITDAAASVATVGR